MSCVNTKSKEFKDAVTRLDLHPDTLELIVHEFINIPGNEDKFPSDDQILKDLNPKVRPDMDIKGVELLLKMNTTREFYYYKDAEAELKRRNTLFGNGTSVIYKNSKGIYVLTTAMPIIEGLPFVMENSIVSQISETINKSSYFYGILSTMMDVLKDKGIIFRAEKLNPVSQLKGTKFENTPPLGMYYSSRKTIAVDPINLLDFLKKAYPDNLPKAEALRKTYFTYVIIHEVAHALSVEALNNPQNDAEREFKSEITSLWQLAKDALKDESNYGTLNVLEFVAEALSNTRFQKKLAQIKVGKVTGWKKLLNIFSNLLSKYFGNAGADDSILSHVFSATSDLISYYQSVNSSAQGATPDIVAPIASSISEAAQQYDKLVNSKTTSKFTFHKRTFSSGITTRYFSFPTNMSIAEAIEEGRKLIEAAGFNPDSFTFGDEVSIGDRRSIRVSLKPNTRRTVIKPKQQKEEDNNKGFEEWTKEAEANLSEFIKALSKEDVDRLYALKKNPLLYNSVLKGLMTLDEAEKIAKSFSNNPPFIPIESVSEEDAISAFGNNHAEQIDLKDTEETIEHVNMVMGPKKSVDPKTIKDTLQALREGKLERMFNEGVREPFNKELSKKLHDILKRYHFEIIEGDLTEVFGEDTLGALDVLQKIVYLANEGDRNALTDAEEFAHAFIELMGSAYHRNLYKFPDSVLYSELRDLVEETSLYKATFQKYKDIYKYPNGNPDTATIKKEALGKALAAVLKDRFEVKKKTDESFVAKLKQWFKDIMQFFKGLTNNEESLIYELNVIADSILDGSYATKYLEKTKNSKKAIQVEFHNTLKLQTEKDGGKALSIINKIKNLGGIITGSLSYRAQGSVYRKDQDALHDIDFIIPPSRHGIYRIHPSLKDILKFKPEKRWPKERIREIIEDSIWWRDIKNALPNITLAYVYPGENGITVNGIVSDNQELVDTFLSLSGNFNERLESFTQEERDQLYLVDFFLYSKDIEVYIDPETKLPLSDYTESFESKLKMGRAKDLYDYQNFNPTHRKYWQKTKGMMYQKEDTEFLSEYTMTSGGADGSDIIWDSVVKEYGVTRRHFYTGERSSYNSPHGNEKISDQDFNEGRFKAAEAARRNWGYDKSAMKDSRLIRNWSQVKHADAVFAIGTIAKPGERAFPNIPGDTRTAVAEMVTGGTGYAVGMAILENKPVYVFDQKQEKWFTYKKETDTFVETDTPILTPKFAGIGTRYINEAGKQAMKDVVAKTIEQKKANPKSNNQIVSWDQFSDNSYEVSSKGDKRFSALNATFKEGTIIEGIDVGGKTIEYVYQNIFKKSGKGKAPAEDSILYNPELKTEKEQQDFSYNRIYLPLWQEWAKQNPELIEELREKSKGKVLTDQFANTRVSQARALADILNATQNTPIQEKTVDESNTPTIKSYKGNIVPSEDTIFVFGSNPEGRHGAGAAKTAVDSFGAIYGQGEGLQGNSYALPTKDLRSKPLYSEDGGKTPVVMYRGYALTEDRKAYNIEETVGKTAVDYDDSLKGALYFTSSKEEAQDYARTRTDKSPEQPTQENPQGRPVNRHYTGDYAKVSKYFIASNAKVEHYKDIRDYIRNGRNSNADVVVLDKGTAFSDNTEYIVKNPSAIVYDKMLRSISPEQITENIKKLYETARQNPKKQFKVAYRNTDDASLNGYTGLEMIDMFIAAGEIPSNIIFSEEWVNTGKFDNLDFSKNSYSSNFDSEPKPEKEIDPANAPLIIVPTKEASIKAAELGGINTLRQPDENGMHFGNPFSHYAYKNVAKVVDSVKEAVIAYEQWLRGEAYQDIEPERRQWILRQIHNGRLRGLPIIYYTDKVPDKSYGRDTYHPTEAPNHAHILQKLIYDESFRLTLVEEANNALLDATGGLFEEGKKIVQQEIADVAKTVNEGKTFEDMLQTIAPVFTDNEIEEIKESLTNSDGSLSKLKVMSVSRMTDPVFYAEEIIKFLEENSKKPFTDPTRVNVIEIWSKHDGIPMQDILQACKKYKVAPMVSFSITGLGDTALEKGVLKYQDLLELVNKLIEQGDLNPATTTIRIDPILVGETSMEDIKQIVQTCKSMGIKKFVTSLVQSYGYLDGTSRDRNVTTGINKALESEGRTYDWDKYYGRIEKGSNKGKINFTPKQEYIDEIGKVLIELNKDPEIEIETCAFSIKGLKPSACLDPLIIERVTGVSVTRPDGTYDRDTSRPSCMCYGAHSDMFRFNEKSCYSSCAYCYAGQSKVDNFAYYKEDGTLIDTPLAQVKTPISMPNQLQEDKKDPIEELIEREGIQELQTIREENKEFMEQSLELTEQINKLYENDLMMTASEISHIAEQAVFWISDHITEIQQYPERAAQFYDPDGSKGFADEDFASMTRAEVVNRIGINTIISACKAKFSSENNTFEDFDTYDKADLITENWDAIMTLASYKFVGIENFSIVNSKDGKTMEIIEDTTEEYTDDFVSVNDSQDVKELEGDLQEHWQIETKCVDVLLKMSQIVKRALAQCYQIDSHGNKVVSEFGIWERVPVRESTNSILRWTQGSITLEHMIAKLEAKAVDHPWVNQILDRLKDTSGKESTFQSQFFSTFCKHFQLYAVVNMENGKYVTIPVNKNPALKEAISQIVAQFNMGEHPLFKSTGGVNETALESIKTVYNTYFKNEIDLNEGDNKQQIAKQLSYLSNILGYPVTPEMAEFGLDEESLKSMVNAINGIITKLEANKDNPQYAPFDFNQNDAIVGFTKSFLMPITDHLEDISVAAFYNSGKMYQSYITPSFTTKLFNKFKLEGEEFEKFIMEEYGKFEWFKDSSKKKASIEKGWKNEWLKLLAKDAEARKIFEHKVQLSFDDKNYMKNMDDLEYTLSIVTEYFANTPKTFVDMVPAWFRVPMLSNKPSSEFIKFYSYRGKDYKDTIVDQLKSVFNQELSRIQTVVMRNYDKNNPKAITNFDTRGRKFTFLSWMNVYLENGSEANSELGKLLKQKIEGTITSDGESKLNNLVKADILNYMTERAKRIYSSWEKQGLVDSMGKISNIYNRGDGTVAALKDEKKATLKNNIENFIWNDFLASINILQLTITDVAYYKNAEDLQKRLAQIHAPGIRCNINATWTTEKEVVTEGGKKEVIKVAEKVSDGKYRTIKLNDFRDVISNVIENITIVFDKKIEQAKKEGRATEAEGLEVLKDSLVGENGEFRKINVTDAQAFNCPTSYRKKAVLFGKWSDTAEEVYQKLIDGEYTHSDLQVAFQPLKPFVYSSTIKNSDVAKAPLHNLKVPVQYKNSEYLLILADAILQNEDTGRPNLLRAIYQVMEESHYEIDDNGNRVYKLDGIDTVQFESAVKSGLTGTINISALTEDPDGEEVAKAILEDAIYNFTEEEYDTGDTIEETNPETGEKEVRKITLKRKVKTGYNTNTVDIISYEDVSLQQDVPAHFKDHQQVHGSQIRYDIISELESTYTDEEGNVQEVIYDVNGEEYTAQELKEEYEQLIADNIKESMDTLIEELGLNTITNTKDRNIALSRILQREILSSTRYGIDLLLACSVDENGEFRIPLGDPIQSKRIEQLINSVIKNRINKQELPGGPVVQVTNFGVSKRLNIRFNSKEGGLLLTEQEWENSSNKKHATYKEYVKENQAGIAYYECFAPIYMNELFYKFKDKNGNIDIEKIELIDPDLLKLVGYRIPTEDKYSMAPIKIVGFLPREAGDGLMLPFEITTLNGSDFDVDKMYLMRKEVLIAARHTAFKMIEGETPNDIITETRKGIEHRTPTIEEAEEEYKKKHKKEIRNYIVEKLKLRAKLTNSESNKIEEDAEIEAAYKRDAENRRHEKAIAQIEKMYSEMDDLNEKAIDESKKMSKTKILENYSDRIDRHYEKAIARENSKHERELAKIEDAKGSAILRNISRAVERKIDRKINEFLAMESYDFKAIDDPLMRDIRKVYYQYMYKTIESDSPRVRRNNKIVDITYTILTHETSADKVLNPGGFTEQKKLGYLVNAFRYEYLKELEKKQKVEEADIIAIFNRLQEMTVEELKDKSDSDKNLCDISDHIQFYKQNNAAGALIGIFAVARVAHAVLESESIDGSPSYFVDIEKAIGNVSGINIDGIQISGRAPIDMRYDKKYNLIGKILGSLVASAADAVKDPVLNLININSNTAKVLITLIRLGVPFETAALFMSQKAITDIVVKHSVESLKQHKSLAKVIEEEIKAIEENTSITKDSKVAEQEMQLSREELIVGLVKSDSKSKYKTLVTLRNLLKVAEASDLLTFATRFNSITSAVGPMIIDNLITEHKWDLLNSNSCIIDSEGKTVLVENVLSRHPILSNFASTLELAKQLFGDMPANSRGFREVIDEITKMGFKYDIIKNKKILSYLSDFYQSYLAIRGGIFNPSDLEYFITEFPKEFMNKKYKTNSRYKDNYLIQSIRFKTISGSSNVSLAVDTTGLDTTEQEKIKTAWYDLYKIDPNLAIKLVHYNFFKGGIGFNPKTFMNLVPVQVKERIDKYTATYAKLPYSSDYIEEIIDLFVRNNWSDDRIVPMVKNKKAQYDAASGILTLPKEDGSDPISYPYIKVVIGNKGSEDTLLFKYDSSEIETIQLQEGTSESSEVTTTVTVSEYIAINPLGNNKEYLEIYIDQENESPLVKTTSPEIDPENDPQQMPESGEEDIEKEIENPSKDNNYIKNLVIRVLMESRTEQEATKFIQDMKKRSETEKRLLKEGWKNYFKSRLESIGIEFDEETVDKMYEEMC